MQAVALLLSAVTMGGDFGTSEPPRRSATPYESIFPNSSTPPATGRSADWGTPTQAVLPPITAADPPRDDRFPAWDAERTPVDPPGPVRQAQLQQPAPPRGVDGLVLPPGRTAPNDPTAAYEGELTPVPPSGGRRNHDTDILPPAGPPPSRSPRGPADDRTPSWNDLPRATTDNADFLPRNDVRLTSDRTDDPPPYAGPPPRRGADDSRVDLPPMTAPGRQAQLPPAGRPRDSEPSSTAPVYAPPPSDPVNGVTRTMVPPPMANPSGRETMTPPLATRPEMRLPTADEVANQLNQPGGSYFLTLLALFASVGLNLYLGWIAWDTYNRYQDLVADMRHGSRRERGERRLADSAF